MSRVGIEAAVDEILRKIGDRHDISPIDVLKHILIDGYKG